MCTKVQLDNISRQIVQSYHSVYGSDIVAIYLYGSYAREDYDNESDIDITAIVKGDRMDLQNKLKQVWIYPLILDWKMILLFPLQLYHLMNMRNINGHFLII